MLEQIVNLIIPSAYADTTAAASQVGPQSGGFSFMLIVFIMLAFFYFTFWRLQNKRAKEQQTLLNSLAKGDEVVTIGGVLGRIE